MCGKTKGTGEAGTQRICFVWLENASLGLVSDLKILMDKLDKLMRDWFLELGF